MDIQAALKDGYTQQDVMAELGKRTGMNYKAALADGHSADEVLAELNKRDTPKSMGYTSADFEKAKQAAIDSQQAKTPIEKAKVIAADAGRAAMPYVRPILEGGGAMLGGIAGAPAAPASMGLSSVGGAALGYAGGAKLADLAETALGVNSRPQPQSVGGQMVQSLSDLSTGAMYDMGGQAAVPVLSTLAKGVGKVVKPILGKLSGVGENAVNEAIKSGTAGARSINPLKGTTEFDKALRGNTTGDEIVDNARSALTSLKDARATTYQGHLQQIAQNSAPIDMRPVKGEISSLMSKYNIKTVPVLDRSGVPVIDAATGLPKMELDTSRIAMGKTGRNDIQEIIETVSGWGSKQGDNTALGLDTLKRQLDDFYSDSSQARQFVSQIRNKVKDTIIAAVPQYDEMTKGYTEATKLIKDVESGLMMKKQGLSGRITADQTLRRLTSAMKDNFEMRKDLVDILGAKGNEDLSGQIAGYTMNTIAPRGLAGTGPALAGQAAYAHFVNPSFWPVLAASSPRMQGEFLRLFGKGMSEAKRLVPIAGPAARQAAISLTPQEGNSP